MPFGSRRGVEWAGWRLSRSECWWQAVRVETDSWQGPDVVEVGPEGEEEGEKGRRWRQRRWMVGQQ